LTVAAVDADLAAVVADALAETGRSIDDLSASEAIEIADQLRTVAALPILAPRDLRLAADLIAAASIIERRAGTA